MTYEEKYTKYKQKYLNLLYKINVLKGGDRGEDLYLEGLALLDQTKILEAVRKFEEAARTYNNMNALNHLFDIYLLGRLGVPKNPIRCLEIKEQIKLLEESLDPSVRRRLPGIVLMEQCYPRCLMGVDPDKVRSDLDVLWGDKSSPQDPRIAFLRCHMDPNPKKTETIKELSIDKQPPYELSLLLVAQISQNLSLTGIPARRCIIEAMYLRGKLLLDELEKVTTSPEDTRIFFQEARTLFCSIEQNCTKQEYDTPYNTSLERAVVSLLRMGEQVPTFGQLEQPKNLGLCNSDRFIFANSVVDDNIRIVSDLILNLAKTSALNKKAGVILGEAVCICEQSDFFRDVLVPEVLPIEKHSFVKLEICGPLGVNIRLRHTILMEPADAQLAIIESKGRMSKGRVFLFCGVENTSLEGPPHTATVFSSSFSTGRLPTVFENFQIVVEKYPNINFVVVCYKHSLAKCYVELKKSNVEIITLAEFIRGNIPNFSPFAQTSIKLKTCVAVAAAGKTVEVRQSHALALQPAAGKTVEVRQSPALPLQPAAGKKALDTRFPTFVSAAGKTVEVRQSPALPLQPAAGKTALNTNVQPFVPTGAAAAPFFPTGAAAAAAEVKRVPPNWEKINDNTWRNLTDGKETNQCPLKVGKTIWKQEIDKQKDLAKQQRMILHQFDVCYFEMYKTPPPKNIAVIIKALANLPNIQDSVNILFDEEQLESYFRK
jgi:hypothetical protein